MGILAKASVSPPKGWALGGSSADSPPPVAPSLHTKRRGQLCSLPPVGLTTSAFKKKHSRNLTASKTGTWTLSSHRSIHGVTASVTLSPGHSQEAFSFPRSWETHQRNGAEKVACLHGPLLITPQVDTLFPDLGAVTLLRKSRNNPWPRAGWLSPADPRLR